MSLLYSNDSKASDLFYAKPTILFCCTVLNDELETIDRNPAMTSSSYVRTKDLAEIRA